MKGVLGEFEIVVSSAVLQLGDNAYGSAIRREIEKRSGKKVSRGAVYATLDRLEEKGLLSSSFGAPSPERGGRAKRFFRVEEEGLEALRESRGVLERMWQGLEPLLDER